MYAKIEFDTTDFKNKKDFLDAFYQVEEIRWAIFNRMPLSNIFSEKELDMYGDPDALFEYLKGTE